MSDTNITDIKSAKRKPTLRCIVVKRKDDGTLNVVERAASNALGDDPFLGVYGNKNIIEPPYDLQVLSSLQEYCGELRPTLDAMTTNTEKLGHRILPRTNVQDLNSEIPQDIKDEIYTAENFFENAILDQDICTFTEFRSRIRMDLETTGNAYAEVIPSLANPLNPAGLNHLPSWTMRLRKQDDTFTSYDVPRAVKQREGTWVIKKFPTSKRFRQFVQIREYGVEGVYFKEWGDPREVDSRTGEVVEKGSIDPQYLAHEVIHIKIYSTKSPYGLPRDIGNLFAIFGSRAAEEINYTTFENNQIPAMVLLGTNVAVTDGSVDRLNEFIEDRVQGNKNYATIVIVEAEPIGEGMRDPGSMKLELKPLVEHQHTDAMFQKYLEGNAQSIRRAWRIPAIFTGRSDDYSRACYSEDTETLTETGWKLHHEISVYEKIAAYDPKTGKVVFVVPESKHVYQVKDENMLRFAGKTTDCLVTTDHTMICRREGQKKWKTFKAGMIPYYRYEVPLAADEWEGTELKSFALPRFETCKIDKRNRPGHHHKNINADDWLEFLGYFISEGSTVSTETQMAPYLVTIAQKDRDNVAKITACLDRIGWKYSTWEGKDEVVRFNISNKCLREWLVNNIGTHAQDKKIPWEYLNLNKHQLAILFNAMMLGDGTSDSRENRDSSSYCTSSSILAGQVQRLLLQLGYRSVVGPGTRAMRVSFTPNRTALLKSVDNGRCPTNVTSVKYTGEVYCFSVPRYGYFVTRRNGKIAIQGNTAEASRKLANEQIFAPEREAFDAIINNTIITRLGLANVQFKSNSPSVTDNYELTQLLATGERSGGLTPRISRMIVEKILSVDLPEVPSEINPDYPFTWTTLQANLAAQVETKPQSDSGVDKSREVMVELNAYVSHLELDKHITPEQAVLVRSKLAELAA